MAASSRRAVTSAAVKPRVSAWVSKTLAKLLNQMTSSGSVRGKPIADVPFRGKVENVRARVRRPLVGKRPWVLSARRRGRVEDRRPAPARTDRILKPEKPFFKGFHHSALRQMAFVVL